MTSTMGTTRPVKLSACDRSMGPHQITETVNRLATDHTGAEQTEGEFLEIKTRVPDFEREGRNLFFTSTATTTMCR